MDGWNQCLYFELRFTHVGYVDWNNSVFSPVQDITMCLCYLGLNPPPFTLRQSVNLFPFCGFTHELRLVC